MQYVTSVYRCTSWWNCYKVNAFERWWHISLLTECAFSASNSGSDWIYYSFAGCLQWEVWRPRFESRHGSCFYHDIHWDTALGTGCTPLLQFLVSAFRSTNTNKWCWWMWMVAAYQQTHRPSWLAWFEGWRPSGTHSAFIRWNRKHSQWLCHDDSIINIVLGIIRPHRCTTYVDVAFCYRLSSMVCRSVCLSVT